MKIIMYQHINIKITLTTIILFIEYMPLLDVQQWTLKHLPISSHLPSVQSTKTVSFTTEQTKALKVMHWDLSFIYHIWWPNF